MNPMHGMYALSSRRVVVALLVGTALSALWAVSVGAQGSTPGARTGVSENELATQPQREDSEEANILIKIHLVNQMEIEAGQLAQQKGQSEQVRRFGERLARAHRDVDQEVQSLARREGIDLPAAQPRAQSREQSAEVEKHQQEQQQPLERLEKAQAEDFDREFADAMVDGHRKTIDRLKDAKDGLANPEVRDLVDRTLPILESHQRDAEQLKSSAS